MRFLELSKGCSIAISAYCDLALIVHTPLWTVGTSVARREFAAAALTSELTRRQPLFLLAG